MNLLKNKWALLILGILILGSLALAFRKQLGPFFGGYKKSARGYYYRFTKGSELSKIQGPGYHIVFQSVLLGPEGDTIENRSREGVQLEIKYPVEARNELEDLLQIAAPGSVSELLVPTDSLKKRPTSDIRILALPEGKTAKIVLHVISLLNEEEFAGYQNQRKLQRYKKEFDLIDKYAAKNKKDWKLDTLTNIKYVIENPVKSPRFDFGQIVEFDCEVYNINGQLVVNSAMEGKRYKTQIGSNTYQYPALEELLVFLGENESGTFLVTSDYGYQDAGNNNLVAPYTPLIIKLGKVNKAK